MTIMLAGGMTIAAPSMMVPEVAAAGSLYVSAENAMFDNKFGGAQIIEVIVIGHATAIDVRSGEPIVKVDENQLRMAQGIDGNWYGYFGDKTNVPTADTATNNLNFGTDTDPTIFQGSTGEDSNTFSAFNGDEGGMEGVISNAPVLSQWNYSLVLPRTSEQNSTHGQIGVQDPNQWPFIQLYDFTIGTFDVVYEQAGPNEVVSLDYDSSGMDDVAGMVLDRSSAPQNAEVHLTITDNQLNIDPTAEDIVIFKVTTGAEGVSFTNRTDGAATGDYLAFDNSFDSNGKLIIDYSPNGSTDVLTDQSTLDDGTADKFLVFYEGGENSGIFYNTDDDSDANLMVAAGAPRGTTATFDYNDSAQSLVVANDFGVITMDAASVGDEWNSGEALTVTLIDQDLNLNTLSNEDIVMKNTTSTHLIPSLQIGSPLMVESGHADIEAVDSFSKVAYYTNASVAAGLGNTANYTINPSWTGAELDAIDTENTYFSWDFTAFVVNATNTVSGVCLVNSTDLIHLACSSLGTAVLSGTTATGTAAKGIVEIMDPGDSTGNLIIEVKLAGDNDLTGAGVPYSGTPFVADVFSFGAGVNNAVYRLLLEETGDNTATFVGSVEYTMLTQININSDSLYVNLAPIDSDITIIVEQDMTDEDSPRINYYDKGADGVATQIADQMEAPTHSGVVSFDLDNYKIADTVVVTLIDQDMNTDSSLIDVYTTSATDSRVGSGTDATLVLDITFDDQTWQTNTLGSCTGTITGDEGLINTGFTLVESTTDSGIFTGSFQVPTDFCNADSDTIVTVTGTDIEVNYQDFRNSSGESIEVGDGASINANTGSVAFDRTVYPVPYGAVTNTQFLTHATDPATVALAQGDVTVHVRVTDADYNVSAMGEDSITDANVTMNIERGSSVQFLATLGNTTSGATDALTDNGKMLEVSPDSGVFEYDQTVTFTSGPSTNCPSVFTAGCVLQGDILTVEYTDNMDASGKSQTVTDSATFDLRNGVLQADKSVYLIGSDMILTLIEPDFDLDNDGAQSLTLDLIEWDSDAATVTVGDQSATFDPEPSNLRETGDSTGIFQVVLENPAANSSEN